MIDYGESARMVSCIAYELVVAVLNNILLPLPPCLTSYVVLKPQPKMDEVSRARKRCLYVMTHFCRSLRIHVVA
jgi:hypothetical protein